MALFGKKCPQCGKNNSNQAGFCADCGTALGGGTITCGVCHTANRSDARYCKECGRALEASAVPEVRDQRWARGAQDFAARIDADDLPGLLRRGIVVEMGTNAMLVESGTNRGVLGPGPHTLDTLDKRILDWLTGGSRARVSVLLVDVMPSDLEFQLGGIYTRDPIGIGVSVRVQAQVEEPGRFLTHLLRSQERYTREALLQYLYPEVAQVVEKWIGQHTVLELAEDLSLKEKLELALEEALKATFSQNGLKFINVRTFNLNMEHLDRIKGIRSKYALQATEGEADAEGRKRLLDVMKDMDLVKLAEETARVEDEERRLEVYKRMRAAVMSGKMDEIGSEAEFEVFLDDVDRQKLLREKERSELLKTWQIDAEDKERARAHMLARLDLEQNYELRAADLRLRTDLSEKELEAELRMERMRASKQYEIEAAKLDYDLKRRGEELAFEETERKTRLGLEGSEHDEEMRQLDHELELGLKGLRGIKQVRHEAEKAQKELEWEDAQKKLEVEMQGERIRMEHELNRLDKLGTLGTEALIAASPAEQGRILSDLKRTEALKSMTEEQILAAAAKDSPDVAHALAEKYRAIAEGKASEREREMYEKLLAEKEGRERATIDAWDKASARAKETTERALDRMAETAQAFARGQNSPPVIITGSGGRPVMTGGGLAASESGGEMKTCTNCGKFVAAEARHCEHCGHKFEGVG